MTAAAALALRARGLSYEQIARKLGVNRMRARYLITSADQEWVARRNAYSAALEGGKDADQQT